VVQYLLKEIPSNQISATSVKLRAPKNVIAARLAITPETLSRILSKLKRDSIIEVSDKQVILHDIDWMRKFVSDA
jgi:CRP-like cAMP-binding protein